MDLNDVLRDKRDDILQLRDIHEAIEQIQKYAVQGYEAFTQDELVQTLVAAHWYAQHPDSSLLWPRSRDCLGSGRTRPPAS